MMAYVHYQCNVQSGTTQVVPFTAPEATQRAADEAAAIAASAAQSALDTNASIIQARVSAAVAANNTFLAIGAPTNLQLIAQVQTLTKECTGIIKLLLFQLADPTGT